MAEKFVIKPNEKQQEAIDILKGQVMLLAGPGTAPPEATGAAGA